MADQKLSALTELGGAPAPADLLYLDHSGTSNSLTVSHLFLSSIPGYTTTATAAGTTTLTVASTYQQYFTGVTTQIVSLPVTSTLQVGQTFYIFNNSSGNVTVNSSGGNQVTILSTGTGAFLTCLLTTGTTAASWQVFNQNVAASAGKSALFSNTMTFAGTDNTVVTFPSTSATVARTDAAQTFTGIQTTSLVIQTAQTITVTSNAGTADINHGIQNFTNSSASAMTITLTVTSAIDGQLKIIRIYDFSAVAESVTWVNTENSAVAVPTTSNGSTTLPLTIGFQYNAPTSKWRCIALA